VGRAAISNPWILGKISAAMQGLPEPAEPTLAERIDVAILHAKLQVAYECEVTSYEEALSHPDVTFNEGRAIRSLRGQMPMYIKGIPGAAQIRSELYQANSVADVEQILSTLGEAVSTSL
ncbi:MAG: tRNA-dihydrouridine synthase, partial [Armatimonadota bacterium]